MLSEQFRLEQRDKSMKIQLNWSLTLKTCELSSWQCSYFWRTTIRLLHHPTPQWNKWKVEYSPHHSCDRGHWPLLQIPWLYHEIVLRLCMQFIREFVAQTSLQLFGHYTVLSIGFLAEFIRTTFGFFANSGRRPDVSELLKIPMFSVPKRFNIGAGSMG